MRETGFELLHHLVVVPVELNGVERRFIFDSGIGLTLVRAGIDGCVPTGSAYTGRRMSGQELEIELATTPGLAFAGVEAREVEVGILDMSGFPPELADVDGFLSLSFFRDRRSRWTTGEARSVTARPRQGCRYRCESRWTSRP